MRLLLDENLDWRLRRDLLDHQVESVPLMGWAGMENGELRALAQIIRKQKSAAKGLFVEGAGSRNVPFSPTDEGTKNVAEVSTPLRERVTVTHRPLLIG